jgi:actin-like ATPase involved in cell morphogenesis
MASPAQHQGFRLGVDFGTSHTTAILRWPDGHSRPLLFEGSPLLPSAVYVQADGTLLVGRDAVHAARLDPARFEPSPKRLGEQDTVHLGDREVGVTAMIAAVLERVRTEAARVSAATIDDVTLTYPAGWDSARIGKLVDAARMAGLPLPSLVPEPVAAAGYFVSVLGRTIPTNSALVVYDFGGGTFDASVVAPAPDGYRVLAMRGVGNVGGVDLDAALLQYIARRHRDENPDLWRQLEEPQTPADRRHRRHLIEDVRAAKEMLSRAESATVPVPLLEQEVRVTRAEFDTLARPLLERTVNTTADVIRSANLPKERVAAVLLVGGSSRIPLIADLLRQQAGLNPSTMDQPETVVAEGSVRLASGATGTTRAGSVVTAPVPSAPSPATPVAAKPAGPYSMPVDPWEGEQPTPVLPVSGQHSGRAAQTMPTDPAPTRVQTARTVPVPPPRYAPPVQFGPPPQYHQPAAGRPYRPRRRRRWLPVVAAVVLLAGAAGALALLRPDLLDRLEGTVAGQTTEPPTEQPYARQARPEWMPAGMVQFVDDKGTPSVVEGPAVNGGQCTYTEPGVVRVQRNQFDVSGCVATDEVKAHIVGDGAVEAHFAIRVGCGGMWIRTGTRGYFIAACANGTVQVHSLANDAPGTQSQLRSWTGLDTSDIVVGLLAVGSEFTVFADGRVLGTVNDPGIASGRVGMGGFAPRPEERMDATITEFRAWWTPPAEPSPASEASPAT